MLEAAHKSIVRKWLACGSGAVVPCTFWRPADPSGYMFSGACNILKPPVVGSFPIAWTMPRKGYVTALSVFAVTAPGAAETISSRAAYTNAGVPATTASLALAPLAQAAYVVWANGLYPFAENDLLYVEFETDTDPSAALRLTWIVEVTLLC